MVSFLHSADLKAGAIEALFERARAFKNGERQAFGHKIVGLLFFENSSRTRASFEMACKRLGVQTVFIGPDGSSIKKGETEFDTARVLACNGADALVMRTVDNDGPATVAAGNKVPVINAGSGVTDHPSQGLLDAFTLVETFRSLKDKTIAIVGDIAHSRVARSNMHILTTLGARVRFVGSDTLLPDASERLPQGVTLHRDLKDGLNSADAVMALRIQSERFADRPDIARDAQALKIDHTTIGLAKPNAFVLHPMPMNRDVEISGALADDPARSLLWAQMENGLYIRMAMIESALS